MNTKNVSFRQYKSLSVAQFASLPQDSFSCISSARAINSNLIEVKEINDSGSVNNLTVNNLSKEYVFFMDGDILIGAKQNRTLNTSVLLAPNSTISLPVSCVEQGRWRRNSFKFDNSEFISPSGLRAKKAKDVKDCLQKEEHFYARQEGVWDDVALYSLAADCNSETGNLADVYEDKKSDFDEFTDQFTPAGGANGIAVFINKKLLNVEIFNRCDIYKEYFPKLLRGTVMETYMIKPKGDPVTEAEAFYKTSELLDKIEELPSEIHKGVGVGEENRFETDKITGFKLRFNEHLIHFTALNLE